MIADLSRPYSRRRRPWERQRRILTAVAGVVAATLCLLILLGGVAYGGTSGGTQTVRVRPGDTLWSIAASHYDSGDVRARVDEILSFNHLGGPVVVPGQTILLPP